MRRPAWCASVTPRGHGLPERAVQNPTRCGLNNEQDVCAAETAGVVSVEMEGTNAMATVDVQSTAGISEIARSCPWIWHDYSPHQRSSRVYTVSHVAASVQAPAEACVEIMAGLTPYWWLRSRARHSAAQTHCSPASSQLVCSPCDDFEARAKARWAPLSQHDVDAEQRGADTPGKGNAPARREPAREGLSHWRMWFSGPQLFQPTSRPVRTPRRWCQATHVHKIFGAIGGRCVYKLRVSRMP